MFAERLWNREDIKLKSCSPGRPGLLYDFLYSTAKSIPLHFLILLWHVTVGWEALLQLEEFSVAALQQLLGISSSLSPRLHEEIMELSWDQCYRDLLPSRSSKADVSVLSTVTGQEQRLASPVSQRRRDQNGPSILIVSYFYGQTFCQLWGKPKWVMQYRIRPWTGLSCINIKKHSPFLFYPSNLLPFLL